MTKKELLQSKLMHGKTIRLNNRKYYRFQNEYVCQTRSGKQSKVTLNDIYNYCIKHWQEISW